MKIMYVLTDNKDRIIAISETLEYQENGNPLVNNGTLAIAAYMVVNTYENIEIPEKIIVGKYCYTEEKGFYVDPDWKPYYPVEQRINALEEAVNTILGF